MIHDMVYDVCSCCVMRVVCCVVCVLYGVFMCVCYTVCVSCVVYYMSYVVCCVLIVVHSVLFVVYARCMMNASMRVRCVTCVICGVLGGMRIMWYGMLRMRF